jgi:hypothetical protein
MEELIQEILDNDNKNKIKTVFLLSKNTDNNLEFDYILINEKSFHYTEIVKKLNELNELSKLFYISNDNISIYNNKFKLLYFYSDTKTEIDLEDVITILNENNLTVYEFSENGIHKKNSNAIQLEQFLN